MLGPASLLDGIVETLTCSRIGIGARLAATRELAYTRIQAAKVDNNSQP